jgi:TPR repeat protein
LKAAAAGALFSVLLAFPGYADTKKGVDALEQHDYATAFKEFSAPAEQGDGEAQYYLGLLYLYGAGVQRNPETARGWLQKSADQGNTNGMVGLAGYLNEVHPQHRDPKALELYNKAAEKGNSHAAGALAWAYLRGEGVDKDCDKGKDWMLKAAGGETARDYLMLASYYRFDGCPDHDPEKAIGYMEKAAGTGSVQAQFQVGNAFLLGLDTPIDTARAAFWLNKAAAAGHGQARELVTLFGLTPEAAASPAP